MQRGSASVSFEIPVRVVAAASVVGPKEAEGPLGSLFDEVDADGTCGQDSWEKAESCLQKKAVNKVFEKSGLVCKQVRYVLAGDLLGQSVASSFGMRDFNRPVLGMYGACSTMGLTLSTAAMLVAAGYADYTMCVTSSHYASAERQFRFPSDYGNQRPLSAEWTVTGAAAVILGKHETFGDKKEKTVQKSGQKLHEKHFTADIEVMAGTAAMTDTAVITAAAAPAEITGITTGRIVDYGIKDSMNMGAAMAPAACDTIFQHMQDFHTKPEDYDMIITGDLGSIGSRLLDDLLKKRKIDISDRHMDCGLEIFDARRQDVHSGGSGCGCSGVVLASYILPKLREKIWKRVLFVPTGALLSKVSFNEGETIPGIAHAIVLEAAKGGQK